MSSPSYVPEPRATYLAEVRTNLLCIYSFTTHVAEIHRAVDVSFPIKDSPQSQYNRVPVRSYQSSHDELRGSVRVASAIPRLRSSSGTSLDTYLDSGDIKIKTGAVC